jgi:hypothetical protein
VLITDIAFNAASSLIPEQKQLIAGVCRNRTMKGMPPVEITAALINNIPQLNPIMGFEPRSRHLLQVIYERGGKEFADQNFGSNSDCPIIYSSKEEFDSAITFLEKSGWIECRLKRPTSHGTFYQGVLMTMDGIAEIEKGLPKMPMYGLVSQEIATGDDETDAKIEHARRLFFGEHSTEIQKRSACEELSHILEPLRNELKNIFQGDTEVFFNLVNNFDIRHNKATTKTIEYPEQLEWIFYSLLNTLNTYIKIKKNQP